VDSQEPRKAGDALNFRPVDMDGCVCATFGLPVVHSELRRGDNSAHSPVGGQHFGGLRWCGCLT